MRAAHTVPGRVNVDLLRSFFAIIEHGSLNKAAERRRVAQSTLTRQMQSLEHEIGGRLFERGTTGVGLTATGHALADGMRPVLASFDAALERARTLACGKSAELRIGYLMSAAADYLHPALQVLRARHPEVKVKLLDLSPGEQVRALRKGQLDIAMIGNTGTFVGREFFVRTLAALPVWVALAETHPLANETGVRLAQLRGERFVGAPESDLPGHNQWLIQICRRAGFRPRILADVESLTAGLAMVVTEEAVALIPDYAARSRVPGVVFRPLRDAKVKWELVVAWQRGKASEPVRVLVDALPRSAR